MNRLFHPGLLIAIALHAILLWFPLSSNSKSEALKAEEAQSKTAMPAKGETVSDKATDETELSPSIPDIPSKSSPKSAPTTLKSSGTFATASSQPPKTNAAKPVAQTAASRPTPRPTPQKPASASRTIFPVPKTVPTFSTPAPFSIASTAPQPSPTASPTPAVPPSPVASPTPAVPPSPVASPTPAVQPSPVASPTPAVQPSPVASPAPAVPIVAIAPPTISTDPFTKIPFYPFTRSLIGSLDLQSPERDRETYAFNTRETMQEAIAFYEKEIPQELFELSKLEPGNENLTIYALKPKNGSKSRYLHFISFQGRTAILLLPDKVSDLEIMKTEAIKRQQERRDFLGIFSQMERIRQQMRSRGFKINE